MKNFLALTLLSLGTPMLSMGDEMRRTQRGNNNAYCQDNEISWLDWRLLERHDDVRRFVKQLIGYRLRRDLSGDDPALTLNQLLSQARVHWHGVRLNEPDWGEQSHCVAATLESLSGSITYHLILNAYWEGLDFELPQPLTGEEGWRRLMDTGLDSGEEIRRWREAVPVRDSSYRAGPRSIVLLGSARQRCRATATRTGGGDEPGTEILISGCNGQLGRALRARHPGAVAVDIGELDIADAGAVDAFDWSGIGLVLNAAGYTDVNGAETAAGRGVAWKVNARAVANLARVALARDITLVHVSTDYVFDGTRAPYAEEADFSPLSVYGASKAAGDVAVGLVPRRYLLRTSWVIGDGKNFVRTMLDLARRGVNPAVVSDQVGRPTFTAELVRALDHLLATRAAYGTYNVSNGGPPVCWADFTREIYRRAGLPNTVADITTAAYNAAATGVVAPRPPGSTLALNKLEATGFVPRDWREALGDYLAGR